MFRNKIFTFIILLLLLLPAVHSFGPPDIRYRILVDNYHSTFGSIAGDGWPHMGYDWYYTTSDYLRDLGFTVISTDEPLTNYNLEYISLIIEGRPDIDFSQEELNLIRSFVSTGGSLLMTVNMQLHHNDTQINDVASLFDIDFGGDFRGINAWIVNEDTPIGSQILQGISEPPKCSNSIGFSWFVCYDGVPITYPDSATVLIKFDGRDSVDNNNYSDIAALIALEFGEGKILAGPYNGVMQPWIPANTDNQNPIFLNAISWLTNISVSKTVIQKPSPITPLEGVFVDAIIDLKIQIRDIEESLINIEYPNEDAFRELITSVNDIQDEVAELKGFDLDTIHGLQYEIDELKKSIIDTENDNEDSLKNLENSINDLKSTNLIFSTLSIISIIMVIVLLVIIRLRKT